MAATTIDELKVLITAQSDQFNKEIAKVQRQVGEMGKQLDKSSKSMIAGFSRLQVAAAAAGVAIALAIKKIVTESSKNFGALEQNLGGAGVVFGEFADTVRQKAQESAKVMGTSVSQYLATANKMGSLFQGTGATVENSVAMTTNAMQRAIDVATAMGVSVEWALESVAGMAKGNFTMMDNLGVAMNDTNIQAFLLEKGIQANVNTMTTAQKVGFAYQMFMERTAKYAGNFTRELTTQEGALAYARASFKNLSELLGSAFAPVIVSVANFVSNYLIPALQAVIPYVVAVMQIIGQMVSFVTNALKHLFGGGAEQTGQLASNAQSAADSMGSVGAGAASAADSINEATSAAKKLKGQLAGFDEMNVLQEPTAAGGGAGAGGGAALPNMTMPKLEWENPLDGIQKKAGEIMDGIKNGMIAAWNSAPVQAFFGAIQTAWATIQPNMQAGVANLVGLFSGIGTAFMNSWNEFAPQISENMTYLFNSIGTDIMLPALTLASKIFADFTGSLKANWDKYGQSIMNGIFGFVNNIIATFRKIYDEILKPIIEPFLQELEKTWTNTLKPMVDKVVEFVAVLVDSAFQIYNKFISPIINWLIGFLAPVFVGIGNTIGGVFNTILGTIGTVIGAIFGALTGVINFITGVFTGDWRKAWDGIKQIFTNLWDGLVGIVKAPINLIIDFINGFISGLNQIKIPDWVPGVGGKGLNIPKIPKLATGGIVTGATIAQIGEAGREAVLPLDNNTGWIDELADKLNGNGKPIQVVVKLGEDTIMDKIIEGINDQTYLRNAEVLTT